MSDAVRFPDPNTEIETIPLEIDRLRRSFENGRTRPLEWRREQLKRLIRMHEIHADEFVGALQADFGKPTFEAFTSDVSQGKLEAKSALKNLKKWTRPERVGGLPVMGRARVIREPLGVVLIISPWNYPVGLLLSPLAGAIAAGNAVVLKPSEVTPHVSAVLAKRLPEYMDPEAITLVEGGVEETTVLLEQRFDHIFYTGNGQVAQVVMEAAAKNLTPVTLELGGKSPCIVHEDADIETAARRIAWGKFVNAGQTCIAPDYVLVHESREEALVTALGKAVRDFYGDNPKNTADYARIVNRRHHERLATLMKDGTPAFGGEVDDDQCYVAPTVLRDADDESSLMRDEIFGPILPVRKVRNIDEAVQFVNSREKPLALYLFTKDGKVEDDVLSRTSSGGACVNGTLFHIMDSRLPFGGVGSSGTGAYHGRHTFETFSHRKSVLTRGTRFDPKIMYPPYGEKLTKFVKRFM
ncbi:aldehyde dehydrogenase family protein [Myxococcota bacterium]|nr:aldehyde dehydrogenase family protein [Myxococcota bacterium]